MKSHNSKSYNDSHEAHYVRTVASSAGMGSKLSRARRPSPLVRRSRRCAVYSLCRQYKILMGCVCTVVETLIYEPAL